MVSVEFNINSEKISVLQKLHFLVLFCVVLFLCVFEVLGPN